MIVFWGEPFTQKKEELTPNPHIAPLFSILTRDAEPKPRRCPLTPVSPYFSTAHRPPSPPSGQAQFITERRMRTFPVSPLHPTLLRVRTSPCRRAALVTFIATGKPLLFINHKR
ncbi:hypothetical protein U1Q18_009509 [Sarracenia purpurea var. burkii]